jgi:hypothetical protein
MSVMSAAVKRDGEAGGEPAGTSPEIFHRGPRMAGPATDQDGADPDASSPGERSGEAGPSTPERDQRRLRLVATERHVTEVRVARKVSTRTLRVGGPEPRTERSGVPRVGAQPACGPGVSEQRVRVQRVRVQRASAQRVRVQGASMQPGGLRLTRRGRRVLTGFAMLVAVIGAMLIWTSVAGGAQAPRAGAPARSAYQGMTQVVVRPGQTLWSVAAAADPSADPWTVIQQISDANALNGSQIQAGQLLWVPKG